MEDFLKVNENFKNRKTNIASKVIYGQYGRFSTSKKGRAKKQMTFI